MPDLFKDRLAVVQFAAAADLGSELFPSFEPGADVFVGDGFAAGDGRLAVPHLALEALVVADQVIDGFLEQLVGAAAGATRQFVQLG